MFGSNVCEVAIGLVFTFGCVAAITSAVYEAFASLFKLRAKLLLNGVKDLLNDPKLTGLAREVYNHALVNPMYSGGQKQGAPKTKPSYIEPKKFALAVIDALQASEQGAQGLKHAIDGLNDPQLRVLLQGMYGRAQGQLDRMQNELSAWFDLGMDRVSGVYKRYAQLFTFVIGFGIAAALNINPGHIAAAIWKTPALTAAVSNSTAPDPRLAFDQLGTLPIGWDGVSLTPWAVLGWLVTSLCALFGAPLWFDILQRLVNLRGTGPRPVSAAAPAVSADAIPMPVERTSGIRPTKAMT